MDTNDLIAKSEIAVNAPVAVVWHAFVDPAVIKEYMFGTTVVSDWKVGGEILWKGEWKGKPYEDKGVLLQIVPGKMIQYTHFSPMTGAADVPENYHTVTVELAASADDARTVVTLSQNNNPTEAAREHSEKNWTMMLESLKKVLEK